MKQLDAEFPVRRNLVADHACFRATTTLARRRAEPSTWSRPFIAGLGGPTADEVDALMDQLRALGFRS